MGSQEHLPRSPYTSAQSVLKSNGLGNTPSPSWEALAHEHSQGSGMCSKEVTVRPRHSPRLPTRCGSRDSTVGRVPDRRPGAGPYLSRRHSAG